MGFVSKLFGGGNAPAPISIEAPIVTAEPEQTEEEKAKLSSGGRAALIATSPLGVLGNPTVSRQQLTAG